MNKYLLIISSFFIGVVFSLIIAFIIIPDYLDNQRKQATNNGAISTKKEILSNINKYLNNTVNTNNNEHLIFSIKTTDVLMKKIDSNYVLIVRE